MFESQQSQMQSIWMAGSTGDPARLPHAQGAGGFRREDRQPLTSAHPGGVLGFLASLSHRLSTRLGRKAPACACQACC